MLYILRKETFTMMSVLKLQSLKVAKEERIKEPDSTFSILCSFEHSNASIAFC